MVEVVDSLVEPSNCVGTQIEQGAGSSCSRQENRILQFWKLDPLILSILTADRGTVAVDDGASPPAKRRLAEELARTTANSWSHSSVY
jgi:hypothetical protein